MTIRCRRALPFPLSELNTVLVLSAVVLALLHIGTQVALPWVLGDVVDNALISRDQRQLDRLIIILIGLAAVAAAARGGGTLTRARLGEQGIFRIKRRIVSAVLEAPLSVSERDAAGQYHAMLVNDGTKVRHFLTTGLPEAMYATLQLAVLSAVILVRFPQSSWIAALLVPAYALVPGFLTPRMRRWSRVVQRDEAVESVMAGETFAGVRDIKASGATTWARGRVKRAAAGAASARFGLARCQSLLALDYFVYWIIVGSIYLVGGRQVVQGTMTVGELIALVAYLGYLQGPLWRLIETFNEWHRVSPSLDKFQTVLALPREARLHGLDRARPSRAPLLVVDDVTYRYAGAANSVLDSFSFVLERGEMVCLSGPSGVGKTTMLKLLIRLIDADRGTIRIGGRAVQAWPLPALRRDVAVLFESAPLWSCSVLDNVTQGRRSLNPHAIDRSLRSTRAREFVDHLPHGLQTLLSSGAAQLSAGQRQRLRLARAMTRTPLRILALDEPTVHLDADLSADIMRAVRVVARNGTGVLIVTHDPTVASWCDREIRLDAETIRPKQAAYAN